MQVRCGNLGESIFLVFTKEKKYDAECLVNPKT